MSFVRRFKRFQVSHCDFFGGNLTEADCELKLSTISLGGCGFFSLSTSTELVPPKEIICSFFTKLGIEFQESRIVTGNIIYVTPANLQPFVALHYGVKFHEEERSRLTPFIRQLEEWDRKGLLKS